MTSGHHPPIAAVMRASFSMAMNHYTRFSWCALSICPVSVPGAAGGKPAGDGQADEARPSGQGGVHPQGGVPGDERAVCPHGHHVQVSPTDHAILPTRCLLRAVCWDHVLNSYPGQFSLSSSSSLFVTLC